MQCRDLRYSTPHRTAAAPIHSASGIRRIRISELRNSQFATRNPGRILFISPPRLMEFLDYDCEPEISEEEKVVKSSAPRYGQPPIVLPDSITQININLSKLKLIQKKIDYLERQEERIGQEFHYKWLEKNSSDKPKPLMSLKIERPRFMPKHHEKLRLKTVVENVNAYEEKCSLCGVMGHLSTSNLCKPPSVM